MTGFFPYLPPNTILPNTEEVDSLVQYWNRIYEEIAYNVNSRDFAEYPTSISSTAQNIVAVNTFGAFIICVAGFEPTQPTMTASLCKSSSTAAGVINVLGQQAGTGAWAGNNIIITSTATNFQIRHDRANVTANFNIRLIGTQ